jgi:glycine cleavage system H protein
MREVRDGLLYTKTHEWIKKNDDGTVIMGITDHAQHEIGEAVFIEIPKEGADVAAGDEIGAIESVKTVVPTYSPVSGKIVSSNVSLEDAPDTINASPYDDGWITIIKSSDPAELEGMIDADAYKALLK